MEVSFIQFSLLFCFFSFPFCLCVLLMAAQAMMPAAWVLQHDAHWQILPDFHFKFVF